MEEDSAKRGLPAPDEAMVRKRCLGKGVGAPDPANIKDFLRSHAAASRGLIEGNGGVYLQKNILSDGVR
jgi:hypothetical protein